MSKKAAVSVSRREHPTGTCSDLIPVRNAKGEYEFNQDGSPRQIPCGGVLEYVKSNPATSESNPGSHEFRCKSCKLLYVVSERRYQSGEEE